MASDLRSMVTTTLLCLDGSVLCKLIRNNLFLNTTTAQKSTWRQQALDDIKQASGFTFPDLKTHKIFKIFLPSSPNCAYIYHIYFTAQISVDQKKKCQLAGGFCWMFQNDITRHNTRCTLANKVILDFYPKIKTIKYGDFDDEFWESGVLVEVQLNSMNWTAVGDKAIDESDLMQVQSAFFEDFYAACQPNIVMTEYHFLAFMKKFGMEGSTMMQLFKAIDMKNHGFLTYRSLAKFIAVIDPNTSQLGPAGEIRKRYLFRLFDKDNDNFLVKHDVEALVEFIRRREDPDVRACVYTMKMNSDTKRMSYKEFSAALETVLPTALSNCLRASSTCRTIYSVAMSTFNRKNVFDNADDLSDRSGNLQRESSRTFKLRSYTFRIVKSRNILNVQSIWSLKDICSFDTLRRAGITKDLRRLSCELNSPSLSYNEQVTNLRYLIFMNRIQSAKNFPPLQDYIWGNVNAVAFGQLLIQICAATKRIILHEKRLLELKIPVFVLGSLHGNIGDLLAFEKVLWPRTPGHSPGSLLFLGNYVGGLHYGMEVVSLVFCFKCMYPKKIYLLRGCQETRKVQQKGCFPKELNQKFGEILGHQVYEAINAVFDCLPLAATIGDKLLCAHSGIPHPDVCTLSKFFNKIPCPLLDPETCALAWDLLWNELSMKGPKPGEVEVEGFVKNTRRPGYSFCPAALHRFLDTNFYSHFIRTSEPAPHGFRFTDKGRVISLFSSSYYPECNFNSACLMVDRARIRVLRMSL